MQYHNNAITDGVSSTAKYQSNLAKVNKSILGSYLQHEASLKMNRGGGCRVSDRFGTTAAPHFTSCKRIIMRNAVAFCIILRNALGACKATYY